jgi:phage terminase small subunit
MARITKAQHDFVNYFIEQDFKNSTAAYRRAYPQASEESARREGSRLLTNVGIQSLISQTLADILQKDKIPLEKRIFDYWMKRAFYDVTEIIDLHGNLMLTEEQLRERGLDACIDSINKKTDAQGRDIITYKFADKDKAADMLQRYIQMVRNDQVITVKDDSRLVDLKKLLLEKAEQSREEKDRIIAEIDKLTSDEK